MVMSHCWICHFPACSNTKFLFVTQLHYVNNLPKFTSPFIQVARTHSLQFIQSTYIAPLKGTYSEVCPSLTVVIKSNFQMLMKGLSRSKKGQSTWSAQPLKRYGNVSLKCMQVEQEVHLQRCFHWIRSKCVTKWMTWSYIYSWRAVVWDSRIWIDQGHLQTKVSTMMSARCVCWL